VVPPEQIVEADFSSLLSPIHGYLTLNDFPEMTGELNKYRLTGGPLLSCGSERESKCPFLSEIPH
jgi:hypothetical protein